MLQDDVWRITQRKQNEQICQPSSVARYHGSAISAVTMRCQKSYLHGIVDDNRCRGRLHKSWLHNIKERTGQSLLPLLRIADDRSPCATITVPVCVSSTILEIPESENGGTLFVAIFIHQLCGRIKCFCGNPWL